MRKGVDGLLVKCPVCRAAIGEKCKDYRGRNMPPHRSRRDLVTAGAYRGRALAPRVEELAERNGKQRSLWDDLPGLNLD